MPVGNLRQLLPVAANNAEIPFFQVEQATFGGEYRAVPRGDKGYALQMFRCGTFFEYLIVQLEHRPVVLELRFNAGVRIDDVTGFPQDNVFIRNNQKTEVH